MRWTTIIHVPQGPYINVTFYPGGATKTYHNLTNPGAYAFWMHRLSKIGPKDKTYDPVTRATTGKEY